MKITEAKLRAAIRHSILVEEAQKSAMDKVASYLKTTDFDDAMDAAFTKIAPGLVRHVITNEINEDVEEFRTGAIEGRFEKRADFAGQDPSPSEMQIDSDSLDYQMGYKWGWENSETWKGNDLPPTARKEAVEAQITEFEDQISEQMVIAALEAANEKVNPIKLLGTAKDAIVRAVREDGLVGGLKKGLPIAVGIIVGEALDNFIIPMAFHSMTGVPIPPLVVGVGDVINPLIISMVGGSESAMSEELPDAYSDYESEHGRPDSVPPKKKTDEALREYIRELLTESDRAVEDERRYGPAPSSSAGIDPKMMQLILQADDANYHVDVSSDVVRIYDGSKNKIAAVSWYEAGLGPTFGPCLKADIVNHSDAIEDMGPLAYDVAIEVTGGLMSDRTEVSDEAERVWDYYMNNRSDVQSQQLDIMPDYGVPQLTPRNKGDDCDQIPAHNKYGDKWYESGLSKKFSKQGTPVMDELRRRGMLNEK